MLNSYKLKFFIFLQFVFRNLTSGFKLKIALNRNLYLSYFYKLGLYKRLSRVLFTVILSFSKNIFVVIF